MLLGLRNGVFLSSLFVASGCDIPGQVDLYSGHHEEGVSVDLSSERDTKKIDHICRDRMDQSVLPISSKLIEKLDKVSNALQAQGYQDLVFDIVSCHRSPATNISLRRQGGGQARNSRHITGEAIDFRVQAQFEGNTVEVPLQTVWETVCAVNHGDEFGGAGYYRPREGGFVHMDVGPARNWGRRCP